MIRPVRPTARPGDGADPDPPAMPAPLLLPLRVQARILGRLVGPTREGADFMQMRLRKDCDTLAAMAHARDPAEAIRLWSAAAADAAADWSEALGRITLRTLMPPPEGDAGRQRD